MTQRPPLVEEILNDTLLVVWRKAHTYNLGSKVSTWIFAIAFRKALKALKRVDDPIDYDPAQDLRPAASDPEGEVMQGQTRAFLGRAMTELSAEHRAVIELTYYQGYACLEIAQIMDCPVATVKTRMFYARLAAQDTACGSYGGRIMAGRILRFDVTAHKSVEMLLPWFVNGTLAGDELSQVEQHLRECPHCKREVEWLRGLQASCTDGDGVPDATASLHKLLPRLDAAGRRPRALSHGLGWTAWRRQMRPWAGWSVAAACALMLALGVVLMPGDRPAALYHTLGASDAPGNLVVVFQAGTTMEELNRILRVNDARVVDGPTVTGAYVVQLPAGRQAAALQDLRQENAVKLVEALGPESDP